MNIQLRTVGIIVENMAVTLAFYRLLGLPIPEGVEGEPNYDFETGSGVTLGFLTAQMAAQADPTYQPAGGGQSLNLQFGCDAPATVDATFARLVAAGAPVHTAPWDDSGASVSRGWWTPMAGSSTSTPRSELARLICRSPPF